jgi:hypothetical protein
MNFSAVEVTTWVFLSLGGPHERQFHRGLEGFVTALKQVAYLSCSCHNMDLVFLPNGPTF